MRNSNEQQQSLHADSSKFLGQQTHKCEYLNSYKKAQKTISRKNRQIETLNRIIKNLKLDLNSLTEKKDKHQQQNQNLKSEIQKLRNRVTQLQIKQIDYQRHISEERLQNAIKVKRNVQQKNKLKRDHSLDYFSQCYVSRNTGDEKLRDEQRFGTLYGRKQNFLKPFNMGQLFMGRKSKIQMNQPSLSRQGSWGKIQLLSQPSKGMLVIDEKNKNYGKRSFYQSQLNFESAISYLKKENQHLKIPIF